MRKIVSLNDGLTITEKLKRGANVHGDINEYILELRALRVSSILVPCLVNLRELILSRLN